MSPSFTGGALFVCCLTVVLPVVAEFNFDRHEIVTGTAIRQTVLPGRFLEHAIADLATVNIDEADNRSLRIYRFESGSWDPVVDLTLGAEVLFVDVLNIGGRDRLITYERGRLKWFDPEPATFRPLLEVTSLYNAPVRSEIPHVDVTWDVNGDGLDDLVVPDFDGFWIFVQMHGGVFSDPVKLGPGSEMGMTVESNPWYQARPFHRVDYNSDRRLDLVFWNENHFEVHLQDERGLFDPVEKISIPDVVFDTDGFYSISLEEGSDESNARQKVLHSLSDLNGDGVTDLITFTLEGKSLFGKKSTYEIHFGRPTPDGNPRFTAVVDSVIHSNGIQWEMLERDLDSDSQIDMMVTSFELGIGTIIRVLLTGSTSLDLKFYRMVDGQYPDKPNVTRKITVEFDFSTGDAFFPSVLVVDLNGDGHSELLVQEGRDELNIYTGIAGPDLFSRRPQKVVVSMPEGNEYTRLVDLNYDGRQDLLMHHRSTTDPHRVTMLIVR